MQNTLSTYEAKTHFSSLIHRANLGEAFIITSHGKPMAKITPLDTLQEDPREAQILAAVERIKARHADPKTPRVSQSEWKAWIEEGRK